MYTWRRYTHGLGCKSKFVTDEHGWRQSPPITKYQLCDRKLFNSQVNMQLFCRSSRLDTSLHDCICQQIVSILNYYIRGHINRWILKVAIGCLSKDPVNIWLFSIMLLLTDPDLWLPDNIQLAVASIALAAVALIQVNRVFFPVPRVASPFPHPLPLGDPGILFLPSSKCRHSFLWSQHLWYRNVIQRSLLEGMTVFLRL